MSLNHPLLRILYAAAPAGLVGGLLLTAVQQVQIVPLIRAAEAFESAAHSHAPSILATAAANVVLATGFALILAAVLSRRERVGARRGLLWGAAGYAVFFVAPSLGLAPELPGTEAASLQARQVWWVGTAAASAAGLWMVVFARHPALRLLGVGLIVLPHLIGAPRPVTNASTAPAELARDFIHAAYVANAVLWLALGALTARSARRWAPPAPAPAS